MGGVERAGGSQAVLPMRLLNAVPLANGPLSLPLFHLQGKTGWSNGKPIFTGRAALWGNGTTGQCLGALVAWEACRPAPPNGGRG